MSKHFKLVALLQDGCRKQGETEVSICCFFTQGSQQLGLGQTQARIPELRLISFVYGWHSLHINSRAGVECEHSDMGHECPQGVLITV